MDITIAKTSGFCFGVHRAVKIIEKLLSEGEKVCTLGQIIHNPQVTKSFEKRGVMVVNKPSDISSDAVLVIRSHGITKTAFEYIKANKIKYVDATCPFVKKIHKIVFENSKSRNILLVAGSENHPEMIAIRSYFSGRSIVFKNLEELKNAIKDNAILTNGSILMVAQTTFSSFEWSKCTNFVNSLFTNIKIFDTICNTTNSRQDEARILSKKSDLMIVAGGHHSSNTRKLYDICATNTVSLFIEKLEELEGINFLKYKTIGIIAGASTPIQFVQKICKYIETWGNNSE